MDLGILFVQVYYMQAYFIEIGRELHLMLLILLPPNSLVYEASLFVFKGAEGCFCVFVINIQ